jgi:hypothetical protein
VWVTNSHQLSPCLKTVGSTQRSVTSVSSRTQSYGNRLARYRSTLPLASDSGVMNAVPSCQNTCGYDRW